MQHETVIVLDFGGQYNQLIARRVRENNVYCEIYSYKTSPVSMRQLAMRTLLHDSGLMPSVLCEASGALAMDMPSMRMKSHNIGCMVHAAEF